MNELFEVIGYVVVLVVAGAFIVSYVDIVDTVNRNNRALGELIEYLDRYEREAVEQTRKDNV